MVWAVVAISLIGFMLCMYRIAEKLGLRGFEGIIPFYNTYAISKIVGYTGLGIASIVTSVVPLFIVPEMGAVLIAIRTLSLMASIVLWALIQYQVLLYLGKPLVWIYLLLLLPFVYFPLLAFSED